MTQANSSKMDVSGSDTDSSNSSFSTGKYVLSSILNKYFISQLYQFFYTFIRIPRLGLCEVCNSITAKYTCPRCEVKTCCLSCLQIHKKELNCSGIRDRTKYIPLKKMTKLDFMSDYNFLEECTRYVEDRRTDKRKMYSHLTKSIPPHLFKLRNAAKNRNTNLKFMVEHFTRRKCNKTYYDMKKNIIYWRLEWIFPNAENLHIIDAKIDENDELSKLVSRYIDPESQEEFVGKNSLEYYQSRGINGLKVLLKAEGVKKSQKRFFELDLRKSLKENLSGRTIVEFPIIFIVFNELADNYDVVDSDDDVEKESADYKKELDEIEKKLRKLETPDSLKAEAEIKENAERLLIAKKQDERRKRKIEYDNESHNYLFADEKLLDIVSSSDSESTEEEKENDDEMVGSPSKKAKYSF